MPGWFSRDIEEATERERREMTNQPTGAIAAYAVMIFIILVVIAGVVLGVVL